MQLARVIGQVVATRKAESLTGVKFLIVQKLDDQHQPVDTPFIAIDATHQAGEGDLVLLESGREAALGLERWFNPADQAILAIVDQVQRTA